MSRDPRMPEWGNPTGGDAGHRTRKRAEPTRGTETSQYLEEQKSTEILLVAVSERGRGQTVGACSRGVVGPRPGMHDARVKRPGMARQRR
jgi:hypothetical protein